MIRTGLVSVTFRKLEPARIVDLVARAGLQAIEWGGDIHVPHGDIQRAKEVFQMTALAGLQVSSYGSYYKVGCESGTSLFGKVLDTGLALQAPIIRVWASERGSGQADDAWWSRVIAASQKMSELAAGAGIDLAFEYHEETLTDTSASACRLLKQIDRPNVLAYWQPPVSLNLAERLAGLRAIAPWLSNLHVFNPSGEQPAPLEAGLVEWSQYMKIVRDLPGDHFCLLEFVKANSPGQFLEDAQALKAICT